jgi:sugar phosphate isomerase/epimerase
MIPKFGNMTNPSIEILKEIRTIGKLGFDFVEICFEEPCCLPEQLAKQKNQILTLLKKYHMFALGHMPWWAELGSPHTAVRSAWVAEGKRAINIAQQLGCRLITFHSHSRGMIKVVPHAKKALLDAYVCSLRELVRYAKIHKIMVLFENAAEKGEITAFKDFKYIVDHVPGLCVNVDIGHAALFGGTKNICTYIRTFRDRLFHIHAHDNNGKYDEHLPIGRGKINYRKVVKELKQIGYDKSITLEVFARDRKQAKKSADRLEKLFAGP